MSPAARWIPWPLARAAWGAATLATAAALVFALLLVAPGDPIDQIADDAARDSLSAQFGYDRGPAARFVAWVAGAARGDLGVSRVVRPGAPVGEVLAPRLWTSVSTLVAATAALGVAGAGLAAWTRGRDHRARSVIALVSSPPAFLTAFVAVGALNAGAWAAITRGWIDRPSWFALPDEPSTLRWGLGVAVLAVGSGALAQVHAELEDHWVRAERSPFVDGARGRGAPVGAWLLRATTPALASALAERAALLAGGLVVVEKVLLVPGVGAALFDAAATRDYDLALGATCVATAWVVCARTLAELVRGAVDPRLRA